MQEKKTLRKNDISELDPIKIIGFDCEILHVYLNNVTRVVNKYELPLELNKIIIDFEFIDPGDGLCVQIIHNGDFKSLMLCGTIIGKENKIVELKNLNIKQNSMSLFRKILGYFTIVTGLIFFLLTTALQFDFYGIKTILHTGVFTPETFENKAQYFGYFLAVTYLVMGVWMTGLGRLKPPRILLPDV